MDEKAIFAEVERRKARARNLGLPDLLFKLYFEGIRYYPAWGQNHRDAVHPDFRTASAIPKRSGWCSFANVRG